MKTKIDTMVVKQTRALNHRIHQTHTQISNEIDIKAPINACCPQSETHVDDISDKAIYFELNGLFLGLLPFFDDWRIIAFGKEGDTCQTTIGNHQPLKPTNLFLHLLPSILGEE